MSKIDHEKFKMHCPETPGPTIKAPGAKNCQNFNAIISEFYNLLNLNWRIQKSLSQTLMT